MLLTYSGDHFERSTGGAPQAELAISDAATAVTTVPRDKAPASFERVIGILPFLPSARPWAGGSRPLGRGGDGAGFCCFPVVRTVFQIGDCVSTHKDHTLFDANP